MKKKMSTTQKKEIVDRIAKSNQVKNTLVKSIIQNFLDEITTELTNGNVWNFVISVFLKLKREQQEKRRILRL